MGKIISRFFRSIYSTVGSTAAEILVAIMIIGIGVLGLSGAIMGPGNVGSAGGINYGYTSIVRSAMVSAASYLAAARLEQIKNANPARAYRSRYGADSGPWTTNMFIEAVYKSVTAKKL